MDEEGLRPNEITLIAMTGPGRRHLETLLEEQCADAALTHRNFSVLTFETFCKELLRRYGIDISPGFQVLSGEDTRIILHRIGQELVQERPQDDPLHCTLGRYAFARTVADLTERLRLCGLNAPDLAGLPGDRMQLLAEFMALFEARTRQNGLLTYPDLLLETARLLESPEALPAIRQDFRALLLDEAQELGQLHFDILRRLLPDVRIALAGTEHLNIRGFPGSEPGFSDLSAVFPQTPASPGMAAEQIASGNREPAALWLASQWQEKHHSLPAFWEARPPEDQADSPYGERLKEAVRFGFFPDFRSEAAAIARQIRQLQKESGHPWEDFAILTRTTGEDFLEALRGALNEAGIPVNVNGMPEAALHVQALLFHALKVFEQHQILEADTEETPLTVMDRTEAVQTLNRHLYEWLVRLPEFSTASDLLASLYQEESDASGMEILGRYRDGHPLSLAVRKFLEMLETGIQNHAENPSLYALCWAILDYSNCLSGLDKTDGAESPVVLARFLKALKQQETNVIRATGHPPALAGFENGYASLWETDQPGGNRVRILSLFQCPGQRFPIVFLPGLVAGTFPKISPDSHFFPVQEAQALGMLLSHRGLPPEKTRLPLSEDHRDALLAKEATLMTLALTRTGETVFLSSHRNTESDDRIEVAQPSPFYRELLSLWQKACGEAEWLSHIEDEDAPWFGWVGQNEAGKSGQPDAFAEERLYHGNSPWSRMPRQVPENIYPGGELLPLSPTGITTYMACPRQYYYKHILNLKTPGSYGASAGTAIHALMETFNRQYPQQPYTQDRLKELAEAFFNQDDAQFDEKDLAFLKSLDPVAFHDLRNRVMASLEDLAAQGYFDGEIRQVMPEKTFVFEDADLPGVQWRCRVDALLESGDGRWDIVDYKSGKPEKDLIPVFDPFEHEAEAPEEKFGQKSRHYQVPLYYMAARQDPQFGEAIRSAGLRFIRPPAPRDGSFWVSLSAGEIEDHLPAMKADLLRGVIDPLREAQEMAPNPGPGGKNCKWCDFFAICDAGEEAQDDD